MNPGEHNQYSLPLVSIAVCTYNGERYLREQVDSLLAQSYPNIEIVVADDASTDGTKEILREYAQKDRRFRYFINEKNLGYNRNFEKVFGLCSADFIAISDQDDIWETDKIEVMMNRWPEDSLFTYSLSGDFYGTDFSGRKAAPRVVYGNIDDVHKLVFNSPVHGHACMFRKELLPLCTPFPPDIFYDWWMSMHAAATGFIGCIPQTLTWHRHHQTNSSRDVVSINDRQEREAQLRLQSVHFIESFCKKKILNQPIQKSLLQYAAILKNMDGKKFSSPMFRYVMKRRRLVFHYKKQKPFIIISHLKRAWKMAYKGIL